MTKLTQRPDDSLEQQYANRKRRFNAPPSIKRHVLTKQQHNQSNAHIFKRLSYVAVAASTLLLVSLLVIERSEWNQTETGLTVVQIHNLKPKADSLSDDLNSRYAQHYNDYLQQKQTFSAHHKIRAKINQTDNGWQLATCDHKILQLSDDLVVALIDMRQIDSELKTGDIVDIAFDQTGIILEIARSGHFLSC